MIIKGSEQVAKTTMQATNQATDLTKKGIKMAKGSIDNIKSNIQTKDLKEDILNEDNIKNQEEIVNEDNIKNEYINQDKNEMPQNRGKYE